MEEHKLTTIQINVPYRGPGNAIVNKLVHFDILQGEGCYKAVPLIEPSERTLANLPPELYFFYKDGKGDSTRGNKDGSQHVILSIVEALKADHVLE